MADPVMQIGRLAMRVEGDNWNAYLAEPGTMENAVLLGSIKYHLVVNNTERKLAFMEIMVGAGAELIHDMTGETPTFEGPFSSPEHERSGHG